MKKHFSIVLGLMVIFSSLFTSCNEDELELDPNICKITVKSEGNGTVSITDYIGTSVNVLIGNRVEVVATPDDGWAFIGWYISGTETPVSTDAAFTFTTSESVTLTARFAKLSDIIIRSGGNGRVAFKGATGNSIPVVPGTEVTVIATPNTDCDFVGWFVGDSETPISTENVYTFTATENIILTGQFSKRPIVTVRSAENGSVSIKDTYYTSKAFLPGTEVTVIATPYKDCYFNGWYIADEESPINTDAEYTFNVTEDITLIAKFSKCPVVAVKSAGNGRVAIKDTDGTSKAFLPSTKVTVIATPDENCDFVGWFVDNKEEPISTDAEYTFKVEENITLNAKFNKWPTVTIRSTGNESVYFKDYSGFTNAFILGSEVTVVATPDENCYFIGWFVDNTESPISTNTEYTFTVAEDITLTAKFSKWPIVTIISAGNGTVSFKDFSETSIQVPPGSNITAIATPDENCYFVGWYLENTETPVSAETEFTFTATSDLYLVAIFNGSINGYEFIDLALPSGTKWANMNVGATNPEEYGGYYAWGETGEKTNFTWSNYKLCNGSSNTITKYCNNSDLGTVDNKTILEPEDDAAHVNWGGSWRIPTKEEFDELRNTCYWQWSIVNGINGYKVIGPNGNSIFLPTAGRHGTGISDKGKYGYYWTSTLLGTTSNRAQYLNFNGNYFGLSANNRYYGYSIRPVCR